MNRPQHHSTPNNHRTRIACAAVTGVFAGVSRAVANWLLDHLTTVS